MVVERAVFEGFDGAFDDRQRGAEFVRDIRDEGFLGFVRLAQGFGHRVEGLTEALKFFDVAIGWGDGSEVAIGKRIRGGGESLQWMGDLPRQVSPRERGEQNREEDCPKQFKNNIRGQSCCGQGCGDVDNACDVTIVRVDGRGGVKHALGAENSSERGGGSPLQG